MNMMDRAAKRFGRKPEKKGAGAQPAEDKAEGEAKKTASGANAPHAEPGVGDKSVKEKPNDAGAEPSGTDGQSEMTARHTAELEAMHNRHQQEVKDMHGRHMKEMQQMHGRHAEEVGNGAGAKVSDGESLPSSKKLAGKGWKTREKGKGGTEPKGD